MHFQLHKNTKLVTAVSQEPSAWHQKVKYCCAKLAAGLQAANERRFNDAERFFKIVLSEDRNSASAWSNIGNVHLSQGKATEALQDFSNAVDLASDVSFPSCTSSDSCIDKQTCSDLDIASLHCQGSDTTSSLPQTCLFCMPLQCFGASIR